MLWLTGTLMSVDEEWQGWGDLLLNPFVVGPWLALTGACAASSLALVRHEKAAEYRRGGHEPGIPSRREDTNLIAPRTRSSGARLGTGSRPVGPA